MASEHSVPFTEMAARIDRNESEPFGGACVIVFPGIDSVQVFMIDSAGDTVETVAQFMATIKTKLEIALAQIGT